MRYRLSPLVALLFVFAAGDVLAQERTIRGTIRDSVTDQAVSFPQVVVSGTPIGTVGNANGDFVLRGVPAGEIVLIVQRIGFRAREVTVPAAQNEVNVRIVRDPLLMDELVVTGRATQMQRRNLPNAVQVVTGEEVNELPQQTIDQALQGRVTGAVIVRNSGAPGGGLQFNIRGSSSVNATAEPVIVVDGVIVSNAAIPSNQNALTAAASGSNPSLRQDNIQNRLADLNAQDIESIEILKGASAAAIYGAKASNGVVIITTRRGRPGTARFTGRFEGGFFDLRNTIGLRTFQTVEEAVSVHGEQARDFFQPGRTFDQERLLAGRNAFSWEASGNVSGGTEGLQYFGSSLWREDEGIIKNTGFDRQSGRVNITTSIGERAVVNLNTNVLRTVASRSITNNANEESVSHWMIFPTTPSFIDLRPQRLPDGSLSFPVNPFGAGGTNPLQTAEFLENDEEVFRFIFSTNLDVDVVRTDRHTFKSVTVFGVDLFNQENRIFSPPFLHFEPFDGNLGTALLSNADNTNLNVSTSGVWEFRPSEGTRFTTSAGFQFERVDLGVNRIIGENLTGGKDKVDAATVVDIRESRLQVEDFGFFIQEELLTLDERLLLTAMARFDQSSAIGNPDKIFAYPKAALSYRIPEPGGFLGDLKFRAAFGQTGNQPLCRLEEGCQKFTNLRSDVNIEGLPGLVVEGTVGAADLKPERMSEFEGGVDLSAVGGRVTLEATGYVQIITDLILQRQLASSSGFATELFNGGKLRNLGFETSLGLTPVATRDFSWATRVNFFLNRSKLLDLPVPAFRSIGTGFGLDLGQGFIMEGQSITTIGGTDPECTGLKEAVPGASRADRCLADGLAKNGDVNPDFTLSFSHDIRVGDFRFFGLFEWRQGMEVVNLTELLFDLVGANSPDAPVGWTVPTTFDFVDPDFNVKQCQPDCNAAERVAGFLSGFALPYTQPASFFKAREISASYELPRSATSRLFGGFFDRVRLRASARDLFAITDYRGLDPEVSNFGNQQVGRSIDVAPFPPTRSFWFGIDVSL